MTRLMLTTALATLALVPAAHAELELTTGGYVAFQAAAFDNDVANGSDRDFQSESEIHFRAKNVADNGLSYGAYIEFQASTSDTVNSDEANLWLETGWGRIELGDQDGAGSELAVAAPYVGIGQVRGSYVDYVPAADRGYRASEGPGDPFLKGIDTLDATKVTYYTPVMAGFQLGASFAPERDSAEDGEDVQFSDAVGNHDNAFEVGAAYTTEVSGVSVKIGGQYDAAGAKDGSGLEDISAWSLGGQLGYQGFSFGGNYFRDGDSGQTAGTADDSVSGFTLGLAYNATSWGVAANYANLDFDDAAVPFEVAGATGSGGDYTAYGVGGVYKLAPGLTAGADLVFFDRDRVTGADTDGYVLVTDVRAAF